MNTIPKPTNGVSNAVKQPVPEAIRERRGTTRDA